MKALRRFDCEGLLEVFVCFYKEVEVLSHLLKDLGSQSNGV